MKAVRMGVARVIIGFIVVYVTFSFEKIEKVLIDTLIIQYSMPIASASYLFALRFNGPADEIAVMTASSTIAVLFLLPVIIFVVH